MYIGENRLIMNWNNYISLATFVLHDKLVICQIVDTLMGVGGQKNRGWEKQTGEDKKMSDGTNNIEAYE